VTNGFTLCIPPASFPDASVPVAAGSSDSSGVADLASATPWHHAAPASFPDASVPLPAGPSRVAFSADLASATLWHHAAPASFPDASVPVAAGSSHPSKPSGAPSYPPVPNRPLNSHGSRLVNTRIWSRWNDSSRDGSRSDREFRERMGRLFCRRFREWRASDAWKLRSGACGDARGHDRAKRPKRRERGNTGRHHCFLVCYSGARHRHLADGPRGVGSANSSTPWSWWDLGRADECVHFQHERICRPGHGREQRGRRPSFERRSWRLGSWLCAASAARAASNPVR